MELHNLVQLINMLNGVKHYISLIIKDKTQHCIQSLSNHSILQYFYLFQPVYLKGKKQCKTVDWVETYVLVNSLLNHKSGLKFHLFNVYPSITK